MRNIKKDVLKTAIPAIVGALFSFSAETVNLMFIGSLGDNILLAAVGLGNIFQNMLAEATFWGLNGALETLVSQAYGSNDLHLCGVYLWRGRIVNTLVFAILMVPVLNAERIFLALGMNKGVSAHAAKYVLAYAPAMYANGLVN